MARTLTKEHLPPGATAWAWKGELYVLGDPGNTPGQDPSKVYTMDGREVELPDDFPSDEELKANREKAERFAPAVPVPLEQTIATGEHADAKKSGRKK